MTTRGPDASQELAPPTVPLVLGVTGHREIRPQDAPALRRALGEILRDLKERYPHSPLRVLSSLAPGADQLVAEEAHAAGAEVAAPLPFLADVYAESTSFTGQPEGLAKFRDWIKTVRSFAVPLPDGPDLADVEGWRRLARDTEGRHRCYANAGGYIASHCHALIALWDGEFSPRPSGTQEIVAYKLSSKRPQLYPWREPLGTGDEKRPRLHHPHPARQRARRRAGCPPGRRLACAHP